MDSLLSSFLNLVFTITKQMLLIGRGDRYFESTSPLFEIIFLYMRLGVISSRSKSIILFLCCCIWQHFPLILVWRLFISIDTCANIKKKKYFYYVSQIIPSNLLAVLPVGVILFSHRCNYRAGYSYMWQVNIHILRVSHLWPQKGLDLKYWYSLTLSSLFSMSQSTES